MKTSDTGFHEWAILELMGHRRLGGYVTTPGGPGALAFTVRIDIFDEGGKKTTQYYGSNAIYCLTPTNQEAALAVRVDLYVPTDPIKVDVNSCDDKTKQYVVVSSKEDCEDDIPF